MRVLACGLRVAHPSFEADDFYGTTPFSDCDCVIIDPLSVSVRWARSVRDEHSTATAHAALGGSLGAEVRDAVNRRREEAQTLLARPGGILLVFFRPRGIPLRVIDRDTDLIFDRYSWLPLAETPMEIAGTLGEVIVPVAKDHPVCDFLERTRAAYEAKLATRQVPDSLKVLSTDPAGYAVAFEIALPSGRIIFVPPSDNTEALCELVRSLCDAPEPEPSWAGEFLLPQEEELRRRIEGLDRKAAKLLAEADSLRRSQKGWQALRRILYEGRRRRLAELVARALDVLGFETEPLDHDIIGLRSEEGEMIVLVDTTATEPLGVDAYWRLLNHVEQIKGGRPRAMILANAQRLLPPAERLEPFSDPLRRLASRRGFVLKTTTELFDLVRRTLEHSTPQSRQACRTEFLRSPK